LTMRLPAHPGLYSADGDTPLLSGSRCARCGQVSFPALAIGCDVCGAPESFLEPALLGARGVVHSIATVHLHRGEPAAPFDVAEIQLDGGPLIRGMVAGEALGLRIGDRVSAVWVVTSVGDEGDETAEPRFTGASA
jgi:uncharacterized OB-fold protein